MLQKVQQGGEKYLLSLSLHTLTHVAFSMVSVRPFSMEGLLAVSSVYAVPHARCLLGHGIVATFQNLHLQDFLGKKQSSWQQRPFPSAARSCVEM